MTASRRPGSEILIVTDRPDQLVALKHALEPLGLHVEGTADGDVARSMIEEQRPELVMLDGSVPGRTRLRLYQALREPESPDGTLILSTGSTTARLGPAQFELYVPPDTDVGTVATLIRASMAIGLEAPTRPVAPPDLGPATARRGWLTRFIRPGNHFSLLRHATLLTMICVVLYGVARSPGRPVGSGPVLPIDRTTARTDSPRPPPIVPSDMQFGANIHALWDGPGVAAIDLERIRAAGQTMVRFDVQWDSLEPTSKGAWNRDYAERIDRVLDLVAVRGLHPIIVVIGTPAWARSGIGSRMTPPDRADDFADAVGYLAARYGQHPSIAFEIWNEPNQHTFWDTDEGPDPVRYAGLLRAAHARIKSVAPDATVLGGSIAFNDRTFLEAMYARGKAGGAFDALAIHPYSDRHDPDQRADAYHSFALALERTTEVMAAHGDGDKPIWITEIGWSTGMIAEGMRAAYLRRAVELARRWPQVAAFCVYQLRQDQDSIEYGLIGRDGTPSGSWITYVQAALAADPASAPRGTIDVPSEGAAVAGKLVVTGWALDEAATTATGVDQIRVYVSGTYQGEAAYGEPRPDIGDAFGNRFVRSGFRLTLDLTRLAPGLHTVEVRARSTVTNTEMAYIRAVRVAEGGAPPGQ